MSYKFEIFYKGYYDSDYYLELRVYRKTKEAIRTYINNNIGGGVSDFGGEMIYNIDDKKIKEFKLHNTLYRVTKIK